MQNSAAFVFFCNKATTAADSLQDRLFIPVLWRCCQECLYNVLMADTLGACYIQIVDITASRVAAMSLRGTWHYTGCQMTSQPAHTLPYELILAASSLHIRRTVHQSPVNWNRHINIRPVDTHETVNSQQTVVSCHWLLRRCQPDTHSTVSPPLSPMTMKCLCRQATTTVLWRRPQRTLVSELARRWRCRSAPHHSGSPGPTQCQTYPHAIIVTNNHYNLIWTAPYDHNFRAAGTR